MRRNVNFSPRVFTDQLKNMAFSDYYLIVSQNVLTILNLSKILLTDNVKYCYFPCVMENQGHLHEATKHQINEDTRKWPL